jgi:hypothetical protein
MPITTIEVRKNPNTGVLGFALQGMTHDDCADPSDGVTIAHDLIEHVNGVSLIGTIDDELEALGAIWYVRGKHNDLNRRRSSLNSPEEDLASDLTRMFRDIVDGGQYANLAPFRTLRCVEDDAFESVFCAFDKLWKLEIDDWRKHVKTAKAYRYVARARMRTGYRKAYKRWEHRGRFAANTQFWAIADAVDEHQAEYEGQLFKLKWGNGKAKFYEYYPGD